jgi:hypothetical protein
MKINSSSVIELVSSTPRDGVTERSPLAVLFLFKIHQVYESNREKQREMKVG